MRLYVLGSGSRGNCCAVEADGSLRGPAAKFLGSAEGTMRAATGAEPGEIGRAHV